MNMRRTLAVTGLLALALTACDAAAEQVAEKAAEAAAGGEVDIEVDDEGGVSVESDQGSFSADSEGQVNIETQDGSFSSGGELPEDLPDLPLVDDGELVTAGRFEAGDATGWMVNYQYSSGELVETVDRAVQRLLDAGFTQPGGDEGNVDLGSELARRTVENDQYTIDVTGMGASGDFNLGYQILQKTE